MHDLVIVGAGPAGLAVALEAAQAGLDVAVLERRAGVVDKACGEGLMPAALARLTALGVDPPGHRISGITYVQGRHRVHAAFRRGVGRGIRRTQLHEAMLRAAGRAGVTITRTDVGVVEQHSDHVDVAGTAGRYLVAADGLHSAIRRHTGLGCVRAPRTANRWGQRQHFRVAPWTDAVEVHWAPHSECYVTPVAEDEIGVAVLSSRRAGFGELLGDFPEVTARLAGARPVSAVRGAGPLRQRVAGRVNHRVLLVGDAAGYVDALTGEGLAASFTASSELVRCVLADRPADYERAWSRVTRRSRLITAGLLHAREHRLLAARIVPLAATAPRLFGFAVDQLAR